MSQYVFAVGQNLECMVGWDGPLSTFFGQVYQVDQEGERIDSDNGGILVWVGTRQAEVVTVDDLERLLRSHVRKLPEWIRRELFAVEVD